MVLIIPPTVTTYASFSSYITSQEFLNSPTGNDVNQLVPGGSTATNSQTLVNLIARASAWADSLCNQKLAATVDTQAGQYRVRYDGSIQVPLDYTPIIAVGDIQVGWSPSTLALLTQTQDVWEQRGVLTIPVSNASAAGLGYRSYGILPDSMYATVQYVNGWADTQLAVAPAAGATSLTVKSGLGFAPGQILSLYGSGVGESVTVAASYVPSLTPGQAVIPLVTGTVNAYMAGDTLTAMPQAIKQAVINLTAVLIKTRGSEALVMNSIHGNPSSTEKLEDDANDDFMIAADLLAPFKRVM